MKFKSKLKNILSATLAISMLLGTMPVMNVFAAQSNEYVDPADSWLSANNRTNELDVNATITNETQLCNVCNKYTSVLTYRVPEYTKSGETALNRGVKFSDGTCIDGKSKGNLDDGTPGVDAYYTSYHWTKVVCQTCGTINSGDGPLDYNFNNNVYSLNPCDHNFFLDFDNTTYEPYNSTYHTTTLKKGQYCKFCKGTEARATTKQEKHDFTEHIDAQIGNNRFFITEKCGDCEYETSEYVTAKAVVTSYFGKVDGDAHTLTVTDLSDSGVKTSVRYGTSAGSCNKTSAPNYTKEGYYAVYYEIDYTYDGETMTENGVGYVWLMAEDEVSNNLSSSNEVHEHSYHYLETIKAGCDTLGYERWQCDTCGDIIYTNYTSASGHNYQSIVIKEPDCMQNGLTLHLCSDCGSFYQETTAKGGHNYESHTHNATCKSMGYTENICTLCGDTYLTNLTPIIDHNYKSIIKKATCEQQGYTTYICEMCNVSYVDDYTEPTGHEWDDGKMITNSTCEGEGVIEYHCQNDNCNEKMIKAVSANGHTPGDEATCTTPQLCEDCGTVLENAHGHEYTTKTVEPTCTAMGYTTYTCEHCGDTYNSDYTDKAEHEYKSVVTKPTCTSHGFTTYSCKNCDNEYISDYTEKLSHNYNAVVTAPTCTSMGFTTYTCKDCEDSYVGDYTDMTEHNYSKQVIEPTCTEHGYAVYTCPDCGKSYIGDYTDHKKHTYSETVIAPTCTEMGYTIFKCNDCEDEYKGEYKNATGHTPSDWIIDEVATIEHGGKKHIECLVCEEILQSADISQLVDTDRTNEDGKAEIGKYFVLLTDKDNIPIFNSEITIDTDDNISIILSENRLLDFADRTTVTVIDTENKSAAEGLNIFVADSNGNNATGVTDENGQFIAPDKKSSTGDDNGTIGKEENENIFTYVVKVTDKLNVTIPNCETYIGESNNVVVKLPDGLILTQGNPAIITITDQNGNAQKGVSVIVIADKDYIEKGVTDMYGKLTVPPVNSGYTDSEGKVNLQGYYVFVNDETKNIENALVTLNEDNSFRVTLPAECMIDYANRITVTVFDKEGNAVKGIVVSVSDIEKSMTDTTNENGQVIVPPTNFDYTDINGYGEVDGYIVTVKNETAPIEKAYIKHNAEVLNEDGTVKETENISVELPENIKFDYADRITVTVTNKADNTAVEGMTINVSETVVDTDESAETSTTKSLTGITDKNGVAVFPPLSEDITDNDGNSNITDDNGETTETVYNVLVEDTQGKIENALVEVKDGKISVKLPDTHTLTTSNQTTVTVTDKDNNPMANVSVTITDATTSKSGTTNANGKVTLPVKSSGGGSSSSGGSSGGGGGSSISNTVNVKVVDKDGKTVSVSKSTGTDKVTLTLPTGKNLAKDDNYYTITVTDRNSKAKADYTVILKDKNGNEVTGTTDENGVVTLPGKTHSAYIFGYDDGTFRPNSNMTRAEAAAIFARLVSEQKDETIKGTSSFADVKSGEWYAKYVSYLEKYGIIKGYNDNTFKPDESVTRAEFVAMTVRFNALFNDVEKKTYTVNYTDVATNYWAYNDIAYAKNIGWLNGYADDTFKGDNAITRAEVVTVVNRATGRTADNDYVKENYTKLNRFTDVTDSSMWYFFDIAESANTHIGVTHTDGETWVK